MMSVNFLKVASIHGLLQCFDAVGWVIWSVKIVAEMTYKVSSGTLASTHSFHFVVTEGYSAARMSSVFKCHTCWIVSSLMLKLLLLSDVVH